MARTDTQTSQSELKVRFSCPTPSTSVDSLPSLSDGSDSDDGPLAEKAPWNRVPTPHPLKEARGRFSAELVVAVVVV
eukprot:6419571-Heterocapsa_arctica.AAC.1